MKYENGSGPAQGFITVEPILELLGLSSSLNNSLSRKKEQKPIECEVVQYPAGTDDHCRRGRGHLKFDFSCFIGETTHNALLIPLQGNTKGVMV